MHVRTFACAVSAVALFSVVGPVAAAHAATATATVTAGPCDAKMLAEFKAEDAFQSAQNRQAAAQQALEGANDTAKVLQDADSAIRAGVLALPWTKGSLQMQQNLGQAVRTYKSLYIKAVYSGPATSAGDPSAAAQNLVAAAQKLVDNAKMTKDQDTMLTMQNVTQAVSEMKAAYPLFVTIPERKADLAQALQQTDKMQSTVSVARGALESCLQKATAKS
jgi:hypothetical protein